MQISKGSDRRKETRHELARRCRLRDLRTYQYAAGETCNVSSSGALLTLDNARPLTPGDELELGIAWTRSAIIESKTMVRATIRRVLPVSDGRQIVAVEFAQESAAPAAAFTAALAA